MTQDKPQEKIWTAALIVIGDEILSGRTQDKNIAQVASWLNVQGIRLAEVRVSPTTWTISPKREHMRARTRPILDT